MSGPDNLLATPGKLELIQAEMMGDVQKLAQQLTAAAAEVQQAAAIVTGAIAKTDEFANNKDLLKALNGLMESVNTLNQRGSTVELVKKDATLNVINEIHDLLKEVKEGFGTLNTDTGKVLVAAEAAAGQSGQNVEAIIGKLDELNGLFLQMKTAFINSAGELQQIDGRVVAGVSEAIAGSEWRIAVKTAVITAPIWVILLIMSYIFK